MTARIQNQKVRTSIYLDQQIKEEAKKLFKKFHLNLSEAINIFLTQSVLDQTLPFQLRIPNEETIKAIQEVENGETEEISFEEHLEEMRKCIKD